MSQAFFGFFQLLVELKEAIADHVAEKAQLEMAVKIEAEEHAKIDERQKVANSTDR